MVPTYSINPASTNYAESRTTIGDVLALLSDNTSKEISPRDIRDAVFSTWESSVIRYTSDGNIDYIGIHRDDVKDKKVFIGKKQISGLNIMSTSLLNSDTDIFLYNTKSDSAISQNFKMSFLAGTNSIYWTTSPYISSTYISGLNPFLSLGIINPSTYGTINIQSGSSASVTINNLNWPSTAQLNSMMASPSASSNTDLFLAVRSGGNIELLTYQSSNSTLGTPGVTTSIIGSTVLVNGNPLEYTNLNPTVATFGGIPIGSTFSNVSIYDLLSQMLYPYLTPISVININTPLQSNRTLERDHVSGYTINYSYTLTKRTQNIIQNTLRVVNGNGVAILNNTLGATLSGLGLLTQTFNTSVSISNTNISSVTGYNVFTFSSTPNDGTQSFTSSTTVEFVWPYFYGFNDTYLSSGFNLILNNLSKKIDTKGDQVFSIGGSGYLYFCYPSLYGTVSSILDGNDYVEYTHGLSGVWTYSTEALSSQEGLWTGRQYYIYRKTLETTIPSTQNYKFNF